MRYLHTSLYCTLLALLSACSSVLPSAESSTKSAWASFKEVKTAYDQLQPTLATADDLKREKFHPGVNPQVTTLSQIEIMRAFYVSGMPAEFIDKGVHDCLAAQQKCEAFQVDIRQINKQRVGNAALDVTFFKRDTEIRGWRFSAVFLLHDGVLVYKTWGGQEEVAERENVTNPLGPVQSFSPPLLGR